LGSRWFYPKDSYLIFLYVSASGTHSGWRAFQKPMEVRAMLGAYCLCRMGTLVDSTGVLEWPVKNLGIMQGGVLRIDYESELYAE